MYFGGSQPAEEKCVTTALLSKEIHFRRKKRSIWSTKSAVTLETHLPHHLLWLLCAAFLSLDSEICFSCHHVWLFRREIVNVFGVPAKVAGSGERLPGKSRQGQYWSKAFLVGTRFVFLKERLQLALKMKLQKQTDQQHWMYFCEIHFDGSFFRKRVSNETFKRCALLRRMYVGLNNLQGSKSACAEWTVSSTIFTTEPSTVLCWKHAAVFRW